MWIDTPFKNIQSIFYFIFSKVYFYSCSNICIFIACMECCINCMVIPGGPECYVFCCWFMWLLTGFSYDGSNPLNTI